MARRAYQQLIGTQGDLSAYIAVAMLVPLLLLLAVGGGETVHLLGLRNEISAAAYGALRVADEQGGVSSSLAQSLTREVDALSGEDATTVSGTPPSQPWGSSVCLSVRSPATFWLPMLTLNVNLGGQYCGQSDLPPSSI